MIEPIFRWEWIRRRFPEYRGCGGESRLAAG
jgi:hypothetical protein